MCYQKNFYATLTSYHNEVTGSIHLLESRFPDGKTNTITVDCGLFQEKAFTEKNSLDFSFDVESVDAVLITHSHIDHIGLLPKLTAQGYNNPIYCTPHTKNFLYPAINDSMKITSSCNQYKEKPIPYAQKDLITVQRISKGIDFFTKTEITKNISATFLPNGHLFGAGMIFVDISYNNENIYFLFTGDYNPENMFFNVDEIPEAIKDLPLNIISEATYGATNSSEIEKCFEKNIQNAPGSVVIPVFSNGRAQEILLTLKNMQDKGILDVNIPITLDGKLSQFYTHYYLSSSLEFKEEAQNFLPKNFSFVDSDSREFVLKDTSKRIMLTSSGTGSYGPAPAYISEHLNRSSSTIHSVGHILSESLLEKLKKANEQEDEFISFQNSEKKFCCNLLETKEFSAHAKADMIVELIGKFKKVNSVIINHGSLENKQALKKTMDSIYNPNKIIVEDPNKKIRIGPSGIIS